MQSTTPRSAGDDAGSDGDGLVDLDALDFPPHELGSGQQAFVLDTDIGFDPDDIYAVVVLLKALELRGVPHSNIVLTSNADNTGSIPDKPGHYRARFLRQVAHALSADLFGGDRARFDDVKVVAGRPGSMIVDEAHFASRPGFEPGQYKRQGQPCVLPAQQWVQAQEGQHGPSTVDVGAEELSAFLECMRAKGARTVWISIGASTNLSDVFVLADARQTGAMPPISDIVLMGVAYPKEGKKVQTNIRLDPCGFNRVLAAVSSSAPTSGGDGGGADATTTTLRIVSSITTRAAALRWLKHEHSTAGDTTELERRSAAWLERLPRVMEAIRANNSNPAELTDVAQTWCFDSNAHDPLSVVFALTLASPPLRDALLPMHPVALDMREDAAHNDCGELTGVRVSSRAREEISSNALVAACDDAAVVNSPVVMSLLQPNVAQMKLFISLLDKIFAQGKQK